jgi:hypothetical protein
MPRVMRYSLLCCKVLWSHAYRRNLLYHPGYRTLLYSAPVPKQAPSAKRQAPSTKRQAPSAKRQAPSAKRQAPSAKRQAPSAKRQAPSAKHQAPSTKHQAPSTKHQAPSTKHHIWLGHMLYRICPGIVRYLCPIF